MRYQKRIKLIYVFIVFSVFSTLSSASCFYINGNEQSGKLEYLLGLGDYYSINISIRPESSVKVILFSAADSGYKEPTSFFERLYLIPTNDEFAGIYPGRLSGQINYIINGNGEVCFENFRLKKNANFGVVKKISDDFWGIHINKLGVHGFYPENFQLIRLWDTGTRWDQLQADKNTIDWTGNIYAKRFDYYMNFIEKNGFEGSVIYTLGMTPGWAVDLGDSDMKCGNSPFGPKTCIRPNIDAWVKYVEEIARRYNGLIKYWEVWNEADITAHWGYSIEDIVELTKITYLSLKNINSNNIVLSPSITVLGLKFLDGFLKAGGGQFVDGISFHAYAGGAAEGAAFVGFNVQALLKSNGIDKPIFNTESGLSCDSNIAQCLGFDVANIGTEDRINNLARLYLLSAGLDVRNVSYYTLEGASVKSGGVPLLNGDFSKLTSYGCAVKKLGELASASEVNLIINSGIYQVALDSGSRAIFSINGNNGIDFGKYFISFFDEFECSFKIPYGLKFDI